MSFSGVAIHVRMVSAILVILPGVSGVKSQSRHCKSRIITQGCELWQQELDVCRLDGSAVVLHKS